MDRWQVGQSSSESWKAIMNLFLSLFNGSKILFDTISCKWQGFFMNFFKVYMLTRLQNIYTYLNDLISYDKSIDIQ